MAINFGGEVIDKEHSFRYGNHAYCARICTNYSDITHLIIERDNDAIILVLMTDAINIQSYNIEPDDIASIPYNAIIDGYVDFDAIMPKIQAIFDIFSKTVDQWKNVFA